MLLLGRRAPDRAPVGARVFQLSGSGSVARYLGDDLHRSGVGECFRSWTESFVRIDPVSTESKRSRTVRRNRSVTRGSSQRRSVLLPSWLTASSGRSARRTSCPPAGSSVRRPVRDFPDRPRDGVTMENPLIRPAGDAATATTGVSRRGFLRVAGLSAVAVGGTSLLAACGSSSSGAGSSTSSAAATSGRQLGSRRRHLGCPGRLRRHHRAAVLDQEHRVRRRVLRRREGLLHRGRLHRRSTWSPARSTAPTRLVVAGKVDVGLSAPDATARLITEQGAPLKIIGSTFQKNPFCILSLRGGQADPRRPRTSTGKKIGVQAGTEPAIFAGFLKANGIDPAERRAGRRSAVRARPADREARSTASWRT